MNKYSSTDYVFQPGDLSIRQAPYQVALTPEYILVEPYMIDPIIEELQSVEMVSFDTETTSLYYDELVIVSLSFMYQNRNFVMLINHEREDLCVTDKELIIRLVRAILSRPIPVTWNARFDLFVVLKSLGLTPGHYNTLDAMSLVFLADTNVKMPSLKWAEKYFLGYDAPTYLDTFGTEKIQKVDPYKLAWYSAYDSYGTLKLGELFYYELAKKHPFIVNLDRQIIPALMYFEETKFNVSVEHLLKLQTEVTDRAQELKTQIYDETGVFLLTSSQQLAQKLRDGGYDTGVLTKGKADGSGQNMSVAIDALENIKDQVSYVKWIIEYKKMMKLTSSYIQPLLKRADLGLPFRFHYLLNNAPTMRLAAGSFSKPKRKADQQTHYFVDMNFQGLSKPKPMERRVDWDPDTVTLAFSDTGRYLVETGNPKMNLRKSVLPMKPTHHSVAIDFAGQELRIAANLCVSYGSTVETRHGKVTMAELARLIESGVVVEVSTPIGWRRVLRFFDAGAKALCRVEFSNGTVLECSSLHKLLTKSQNGYTFKRVGDLVPGVDQVVEASDDVSEEEFREALRRHDEVHGL